ERLQRSRKLIRVVWKRIQITTADDRLIRVVRGFSTELVFSANSYLFLDRHLESDVCGLSLISYINFLALSNRESRGLCVDGLFARSENAEGVDAVGCRDRLLLRSRRI